MARLNSCWDYTASKTSATTSSDATIAAAGLYAATITTTGSIAVDN
jgi:hypothetical protein